MQQQDTASEADSCLRNLNWASNFLNALHEDKQDFDNSTNKREVEAETEAWNDDLQEPGFKEKLTRPRSSSRRQRRLSSTDNNYASSAKSVIEKKYEELEKDNMQLFQSYMSIKSERDRERIQTDQLTKQYAFEIEFLKKENKRAGEHVLITEKRSEDLECRLTEAQTKIDYLRHENEKLKELNKEIMNSLKAQQNKVVSRKIEDSTNAKKIENLEKIKEELEKKVKRITSEYKCKIEGVCKELGDMESHCCELEKQNSLLESRLQNCLKETKSTNENHNSIEIKNIKEKCGRVIFELQNKVSHLEVTIKEKDRILDIYETKSENRLNNMEQKINEKLRILENEYNSLEHKNDIHIYQVSNRFDILEARIQGFKKLADAKNAETSQNLDICMADLEKKKNECSNIRKQNLKLTEQIGIFLNAFEKQKVYCGIYESSIKYLLPQIHNLECEYEKMARSANEKDNEKKDFENMMMKKFEKEKRKIKKYFSLKKNEASIEKEAIKIIKSEDSISNMWFKYGDMGNILDNTNTNLNKDLLKLEENNSVQFGDNTFLKYDLK